MYTIEDVVSMIKNKNELDMDEVHRIVDILNGIE